MTKCLLLACLCSVAAFAQGGSTRDTTPDLVPAVASAALTSTVRVFQITLSEESGSNVVCTIKDRQSSPRILFSGTVNASSLYIMSFPMGRLMPSGVTWSCASGTAVTGAITYR